MLQSAVFNVSNMSLNAICEIRILRKISKHSICDKPSTPALIYFCATMSKQQQNHHLRTDISCSHCGGGGGGGGSFNIYFCSGEFLVPDSAVVKTHKLFKLMAYYGTYVGHSENVLKYSVIVI